MTSGGPFILASAGAELHDHIAARFLGQQQGPVGSIEHRLGGVAWLGFRDAEAGGYLAAAENQLRQFSESAADLLGPLVGRRHVAIRAEHDEFLAAISGDKVAGAAGALQQLSETLDDLVPRRMAEVVVDALEVIDVAN